VNQNDDPFQTTNLLFSIGGSAHREGMLQGADGGFTAGPPAQRSSEPALLLLLGPHSWTNSQKVARQRRILAAL